MDNCLKTMMLFDLCVLPQCFYMITKRYDKYMQELTSSAGEDVIFAMNTFIKRLLAVSDPAKMKVKLDF